MRRNAVRSQGRRDIYDDPGTTLAGSEGKPRFSVPPRAFEESVAASLFRHSPLHVFLPGVEMALVYPERRRAPGVAVAARHFFPRPSLMCSALATRHSCKELAENVLFA